MQLFPFGSFGDQCQVIYTPPPGFSSPPVISFTVQVSDIDGSNDVVVNVTVDPQGPPVIGGANPRASP
ncbi:MAG: hypothetical protein HC888_17465 [Candidatus Competibacteraceae bacterium]|nr:hypothetical protein [Candidatus Competibacteraceae bacterium]